MINWTSERLAVGCSAWLDVPHADLFFICFAALGVAALVEAYLRSGLIEKRLRMPLYFAEFSSAIVAVWAVVSFPIRLLIFVELRLKLAYALKRIAKLEIQRSELLMRERNALVFNAARGDVADNALDGLKHDTSNEKELSDGHWERALLEVKTF